MKEKQNNFQNANHNLLVATIIGVLYTHIVKLAHTNTNQGEKRTTQHQQKNFVRNSNKSIKNPIHKTKNKKLFYQREANSDDEETKTTTTTKLSHNNKLKSRQQLKYQRGETKRERERKRREEGEMSLVGLKEDLRLLERLYQRKFPTSSAPSADRPCTSSSLSSLPSLCCFRIISSNMDELVCELIDTDNKKYRIIANICVSRLVV